MGRSYISLLELSCPGEMTAPIPCTVSQHLAVFKSVITEMSKARHGGSTHLQSLYFRWGVKGRGRWTGRVAEARGAPQVQG